MTYRGGAKGDSCREGSVKILFLKKIDCLLEKIEKKCEIMM